MWMIDRIKRWLALRKAKQEEKKRLPTDEDIKKEEQRFQQQVKGITNMFKR